MSAKKKGPTLRIIRGDDKTWILFLRTPAGAAINITGMTVYFTVKTAPDDDLTDAAAVLKKDITSHFDATGGKTYLILVPADTKAKPVSGYSYDIQVKDAGGKIVTTSLGDFIIDPEITNRA